MDTYDPTTMAFLNWKEAHGFDSEPCADRCDVCGRSGRRLCVRAQGDERRCPPCLWRVWHRTRATTLQPTREAV